MFYAPDIQGRVDDLNKDTFLDRSMSFKDVIITNQLIILSASFELYSNNFFESFVSDRPKFLDSSTGKRNDEGNQFFSEITKIR